MVKNKAETSYSLHQNDKDRDSLLNLNFNIWYISFSFLLLLLLIISHCIHSNFLRKGGILRDAGLNLS